jgi:hypothetical protein
MSGDMDNGCHYCVVKCSEFFYNDEDNNKVSDILVVFCIGLRWTNTTVIEGTRTFFVINYYYNETDILVEQTL